MEDCSLQAQLDSVSIPLQNVQTCNVINSPSLPVCRGNRIGIYRIHPGNRSAAGCSILGCDLLPNAPGTGPRLANRHARGNVLHIVRHRYLQACQQALRHWRVLHLLFPGGADLLHGRGRVLAQAVRLVRWNDRSCGRRSTRDDRSHLHLWSREVCVSFSWVEYMKSL